MHKQTCMECDLHLYISLLILSIKYLMKNDFHRLIYKCVLLSGVYKYIHCRSDSDVTIYIIA